ncbi:MAG: MmcQ/YjbR family DNA-binding protein [Candidatus Kapaibacterium sp.]
MTLDSARTTCRALPGCAEDQPFGPENLVFKVGVKVFAILPLDADPATINLKCDPDRAERLREEYAGVMPGYHMNKRHWNTIVLDGDVPERLVQELIRHSYELVMASLPRAVREGMGE